MQRPKLKVWWVSTPSPGNFGDLLTPKILDYFDIPFEHSSDFDTLAVGSIAKLAVPGTMILGSGAMNLSDKLCPTADWKFVRGPITRNLIVNQGGACPEIYGDAALLLPLMLDESKKEYDVGIIPHYVDHAEVSEKYKDYKIINLLTADPFEAAAEITKCRSIVSSSLHGIICAHAYGIPAAWVKFSNRVKGDDIKFYDYFASVNLMPQISTVDNLIFTCPRIDVTPIAEEFLKLKNSF